MVFAAGAFLNFRAVFSSAKMLWSRRCRYSFLNSPMKIFSIGGIYSPSGSPETIEKSPEKIKRENRQKRGDRRGRGTAGTAEIMVVSFSLRSPRSLFLCGLFF